MRARADPHDSARDRGGAHRQGRDRSEARRARGEQAVQALAVAAGRLDPITWCLGDQTGSRDANVSPRSPLASAKPQPMGSGSQTAIRFGPKRVEMRLGVLALRTCSPSAAHSRSRSLTFSVRSYGGHPEELRDLASGPASTWVELQARGRARRGFPLTARASFSLGRISVASTRLVKAEATRATSILDAHRTRPSAVRTALARLTMKACVLLSRSSKLRNTARSRLAPFRRAIRAILRPGRKRAKRSANILTKTPRPVIALRGRTFFRPEIGCLTKRGRQSVSASIDKTQERSQRPARLRRSTQASY